MQKFQRMPFGEMAIGTRFYDTIARENMRKVSATHGEYMTGANLKGKACYIGMGDEYEAKTPIGYQLANEQGENIQGDAEDSSGFASFEILSKPRAQLEINANPGAGLQLFAIYPGDIEAPQMIE